MILHLSEGFVTAPCSSITYYQGYVRIKIFYTAPCSPITYHERTCSGKVIYESLGGRAMGSPAEAIRDAEGRKATTVAARAKRKREANEGRFETGVG